MTDSWFMIMDVYDISHIFSKYIYIYSNEAVVQKPLFHSSEHKLQKQHFNTLTAETPQMMTHSLI